MFYTNKTEKSFCNEKPKIKIQCIVIFKFYTNKTVKRFLKQNINK